MFDRLIMTSVLSFCRDVHQNKYLSSIRYHIQLPMFVRFYLKDCFLCPGLKGQRGASSNRIIHPSVCLSVRSSVPLTNKVQYLKFG